MHPFLYSFSTVSEWTQHASANVAFRNRRVNRAGPLQDRHPPIKPFVEHEQVLRIDKTYINICSENLQ